MKRRFAATASLPRRASGLGLITTTPVTLLASPRRFQVRIGPHFLIGRITVLSPITRRQKVLLTQHRIFFDAQKTARNVGNLDIFGQNANCVDDQNKMRIVHKSQSAGGSVEVRRVEQLPMSVAIGNKPQAA
jgi:hypothetical protein